MTERLFFDTDCLSAFLWVRRQGLLPRLYPDGVVIPRPVYRELSRPGAPHLRQRLDALLAQHLVSVQDIAIDSEAYATYYQLTEAPAPGHKVIGSGEAASIALAREQGGIVASNNLKDIQACISQFRLRHVTTGDILTDAYRRGILTLAEGNTIWAAMLAKRRRLGAVSFSAYLDCRQISSCFESGIPSSPFPSLS